VEKITLLNYKKNGKFDFLIDSLHFSSKEIHYIEGLGKNCFYIPNVDFHNDFVIILEGNATKEKHEFSNVVVNSFENSSLTYYKVVQYNYNSNLYKDEDCNFFIENPILDKDDASK
jgi:hypothetical protein